MIIRRSFQAVLLSFALVAAGCGGKGSSSTSTSGSTGTSAGAGSTSAATTGGSTASSGSSTTTGSGSSTGSTGTSGTTGFQSALAITPASSSLAAGTHQQLHATVISADGSTQDVTATATWHSSDVSVATVDGSGLLTAVGPGAATLTATLNGQSATAHVTVTAATLTAIQVGAPSLGLAAGTSELFAATGLFSDGTTQDLTTQVSWSSSDPTIASVDDSATKGLVDAHAPGQVLLTAADPASGLQGSAHVVVTAASLVSIDVEPATASVAAGTTQGFTATGTFSDGTTQDLTSQVSWTSDDQSVAVIDPTGLATGLTPGVANLTATSGSVSATAQLTVTAATLVRIDLSPAAPTLPKGTSTQVSAIGTYSDGSTQDLTTQVGWVSADPTIAAVSSSAGSQGVVLAVAPGGTTVTASDAASGLSASATVTVTDAVLVSIEVQPASSSVPAGLTLQYAASGLFSDGTVVDITSAVTWSTSDASLATISNASNSHGLATGFAVGGPVTVTASDPASGVSGSTDLTVSAPLLVSIQVAPDNATVVQNTFQQFTATGVYTDRSTQDLTAGVIWTSSNEAVATFANSQTPGNLQGVSLGTASVQATGFNLTSNAAGVTVVAKSLVGIAVSPNPVFVSAGASVQLTATGSYNDGSTADLTASVSWLSSDTSRYTVSASGLLSASGTGAATVYAVNGNITGSAQINAPICNPNVMVLGAQFDSALVSALNAAGMSATLVGPQSSYSGAPAASSFGAVIVMPDNDYSSDMPAAGQQSLVDAHATSTGLVFTEWSAYEVSNGNWTGLAPLLLLARTQGGEEGTPTWTVDNTLAAHPLWAGLPPTFGSVNLGFNETTSVSNGGTALASFSCTGGNCDGISYVGEAFKDGPTRTVEIAHAATYGTYNPWSDVNLTRQMTNAARWAAKCL